MITLHLLDDAYDKIFGVTGTIRSRGFPDVADELETNTTDIYDQFLAGMASPSFTDDECLALTNKLEHIVRQLEGVCSTLNIYGGYHG